MISWHTLQQAVSFCGHSALKVIIITHCSLLISHSSAAAQSPLTLVELNCENLFDCCHDSLKQDTEWMPAGQRRWTRARYWRKLNHIGQELISCISDSTRLLPDLVALVEVENDSVLRDLTRRSLLRNAGYEYLMTESPDVRGIDVALLYQPFSFRPLCYDCMRVEPVAGMRPTRDILYVAGEVITGDTLHLFVVHAPSRYGGKRATESHRMQVARRLQAAADSIRRQSPRACIVVAGDFNDEPADASLQYLEAHGLHDVTRTATGSHGAKTAYRYRGRWSRIDHVLVSQPLLDAVAQAYVNDAPFLLEEDDRYGGVKPFRTYNGYRYQRGYSDHLPLVVRFRMGWERP